MIDLEKLNIELENFTLEECLVDDNKLDRFFKLISIKQAIVQIKQAETQTEMFESMTKIQENIDPNMINELLKNNSIQDLMKKNFAVTEE